MSTQNIVELRRHLFAALEGLTDKNNPMEIERARAVAEVAQCVINSAKVEVDHMKIAGAEHGSGFIGLPEKPAAKPPATPPAGTKKSDETVITKPGHRIINHTLRG